MKKTVDFDSDGQEYIMHDKKISLVKFNFSLLLKKNLSNNKIVSKVKTTIFLSINFHILT